MLQRDNWIEFGCSQSRDDRRQKRHDDEQHGRRRECDRIVGSYVVQLSLKKACQPNDPMMPPAAPSKTMIRLSRRIMQEIVRDFAHKAILSPSSAVLLAME